jgi:hypothetical protein
MDDLDAADLADFLLADLARDLTAGLAATSTFLSLVTMSNSCR